MPVAAGWTVRQAIDRIIELGLASGRTGEVVSDAELDLPLLKVYDSLPIALGFVLEEVGIGFWVPTDDIVTPGDEAEAYETVLQEAARRTGGLVTVTDVEMPEVADPDYPVLQFRCNGILRSWTIELRGDYLDLMTICEHIDDLDVPPRVWNSMMRADGCDIDDVDLINVYFFGEVAPLAALADDFGVELTWPTDPYSTDPDSTD